MWADENDPVQRGKLKVQQKERRTMRQWPGMGTVMVGKQRAGRVYGAVGICGHSLSTDFFFFLQNKKQGGSFMVVQRLGLCASTPSRGTGWIPG